MNVFKDLTSSQTKVMLYLILKSGSIDTSYTASINKMTDDLNLSHTTVIKALRELKEKRWIQILDGREQGNHVPNTYFFLFDKKEVLRNSVL